MNDEQEGIKTGSGRWDMYEWLSSVLAVEQDEASWRFHTSQEFLDTLAERAEEQGITEAAKPLADHLSSFRDQEPGDTLMTLAVDYAQLFIGPGPGKAPPYESIYTSEEGRLYADAYASLVEFLHDEGIAVADDFSAPADHAAVELAVAAHLIQRASEQDGADDEAIDEAQATYLRTHVFNWFPRWSSDVQKHAQTDFYGGVARLLAAFIDCERARLADRVPA